MKGYDLHGDGVLTSAMEDYIEMVSRLSQSGDVRARELAGMLHVRASSVTKMVQHLTALGYFNSEKYGKMVLY